MPPAPVPIHEADRLRTLEQYKILDSGPEQSYDDLIEVASHICGTPIALISLVAEDRQWFKAARGVDVDSTPRSQSICAYAVQDGQTLVVEDTLLDPRFADNPLVLGDPGIRFYAGSPLIAPDGSVLGTLCVIDQRPRALDAAQRSALEALSRQAMALIEARREVIESRRKTDALIESEKLAAVGRLASTIAHEINNPLEAITNLVYLCRVHANDAKQIQWLDQAELELRRVSNISRQALRFHRQLTHAASTDCLFLLNSALEVYEARLRNAAITVESRHRDAREVRCYDGDIRQVLSNLVVNSIDAMRHGGRLLVRTRNQTDWRTGRPGISITIADTGSGMSAASLQRAFEPFFTTKGLNGSGLGLWICSEIMHRSEGALRLRSSDQPARHGTVARLFLPTEMVVDPGRPILEEFATETTAAA